MMKKTVLIGLYAILLLFTCFVAQAAGKLDIVQDNFYVVHSYKDYGYCYAKVTNKGDKPIKVNAGLLEVYDENGDAITSKDYITAWAEYLQPGEYTYARSSVEIEGIQDGVKVDDYSFTLSGKSDNTTKTLRLPCETEMVLNDQYAFMTRDWMYVTFTNNTDQPLANITVVAALLDADGNILYVDEDCLYGNRFLLPGSGMTIRIEVSSAFRKYYNEHNMVPTQVDAIVYSNIKAE